MAGSFCWYRLVLLVHWRWHSQSVSRSPTTTADSERNNHETDDDDELSDDDLDVLDDTRTDTANTDEVHV